MDRWNIVVTLNYLAHDREVDVVLARCPEYRTPDGRAKASAMVALASLTRRGFADGDLSTVMSPRTVVTWAENATLFHDVALAFRLTFLNRCDEDERALVFDEYDAGRADVMFVIQRVLEVEGRLTLLDQSRVIEPHASFRLFATANTVGLGDASGLYHGTQPLNQGQMDRWNIVVTLNYLAHDREVDVVLARCPEYRTTDGWATASAMVALANLTRRGFADGDLSTVMSPRTVVTWAENTTLFKDTALAFKLTFLNRCDEDERALVAEYFQRCMGEDLSDERSAPGRR
jgi:MoxR-like ATPase